MALTVNTNVASLSAQRSLGGSQNMLNTSLERLSTGLRINSAKDDAAGLAIGERFTSQVRGLNQAARNTNDAISLVQTAEGALKEVSSNLQRIRELAVQSVNATNSASDRDALDGEVQQLIAEIDRVAAKTEFNGTALLDGTLRPKPFRWAPMRATTITNSGYRHGNCVSASQWNVLRSRLQLQPLRDCSLIDGALSAVNSTRASLGAFKTGLSQLLPACRRRLRT